MSYDENELLVCSMCGNDVSRKKWSQHWDRAHGVTDYNHRNELKDGELPTNPYWLAIDDGSAMVELDQSLVKLPDILERIESKEKIPWKLRDYTFRLI